MDVADVGPLPSLPSPRAGDRFTLSLRGRPPEKTFGRSMRNERSTQRPRFLALRDAAIMAMAGRKWYEGPVGLELTYWTLSPPGPFDHGYLDGIMDTLGGSHGPTFIYLPIVYLDDCQVALAGQRAERGADERYQVSVTFV